MGHSFIKNDLLCISDSDLTGSPVSLFGKCRASSVIIHILQVRALKLKAVTSEVRPQIGLESLTLKSIYSRALSPTTIHRRLSTSASVMTHTVPPTASLVHFPRVS